MSAHGGRNFYVMAIQGHMTELDCLSDKSLTKLFIALLEEELSAYVIILYN